MPCIETGDQACLCLLRSPGSVVDTTALEHTRVGTLLVATIYLQLIQNRYMFRSFTVLHCSPHQVEENYKIPKEQT